VNTFSWRWTPVVVLAGLWRQLLNRLLPQPQPQPRPPLLEALLHQARRLRTVHQALELRHLAACWLAAPHRQLLEQALQQRLQQLPTLPPSPKSRKSSSSRTRTGRSTTKRRR
jgi:hypothetical protein